jgi:hypothetical protein
VAGGWRRLHYKELHKLYASLNAIRVIKSRKMDGRACSTHGRDKNAYRIFIGNLKGREFSEDLGVDGRVILEWMLGKYGGKMWTGCMWLRAGTSGGLL